MDPGSERRRGIDPDRVLAGWERPVYMVHEHHSRSHHFDLRLEFDGVLRSWAVPKGLSTQAGVRRLAMEVPDHALSYAPFEGEIPEGSYGAGKVEVWDRGTFDVLEQAPDRLVLAIRGRRVQGVYHLVRAAFRDRADGRSWLVSLQAPLPKGPATPAQPAKGLGRRPTRTTTPHARRHVSRQP